MPSKLTKTIVVTGYRYDELNDNAKSVVRQNIGQMETEYGNVMEAAIDDLASRFEAAGIVFASDKHPVAKKDGTTVLKTRRLLSWEYNNPNGNNFFAAEFEIDVEKMRLYASTETDGDYLDAVREIAMSLWYALKYEVELFHPDTIERIPFDVVSSALGTQRTRLSREWWEDAKRLGRFGSPDFADRRVQLLGSLSSFAMAVERLFLCHMEDAEAMVFSDEYAREQCEITKFWFDKDGGLLDMPDTVEEM